MGDDQGKPTLILHSLLKNSIISSQITASVVEGNGMKHSAEGETRELAVASLERMVANLQRVEKSAPRLVSLMSCHG